MTPGWPLLIAGIGLVAGMFAAFRAPRLWLGATLIGASAALAAAIWILAVGGVWDWRPGFIIGGGHGSGEVYSGGMMIGTAKVTQLNVGATFGGQITQQVIFFKDRYALDSFTRGGFEFDAAASAVAINSGAAASVVYSNGIAAFVMPKKGAMVQASLGTQKFAYTPN